MQAMPYSAEIMEIERNIFRRRVESLGVCGNVMVQMIADDGGLIQRYERVERSRCETEMQNV